jgi:protocatechuate 3,4-dioxygenase alpha subunit
MVEIWQADEQGRYRPDFGWGRAGTDAEGRYSFRTVKPGSVDGQAPHLVMLVFARGLLRPVLTRVYFPGDAANDHDPVLAAAPEGERGTMVAKAVDGGFRFDVCLQGDAQTAFFEL